MHHWGPADGKQTKNVWTISWYTVPLISAYVRVIDTIYTVQCWFCYENEVWPCISCVTSPLWQWEGLLYIYTYRHIYIYICTVQALSSNHFYIGHPCGGPAVLHKFVLWTNCLNLEYEVTCNLGIYKFVRWSLSK